MVSTNESYNTTPRALLSVRYYDKTVPTDENDNS